MDPHALEVAARGLLSSVMIGGEWSSCLDDLMTAMNALGGGPSRAAPPHFYGVPSSGVRDLFVDVRAGRCPPLTKNAVLPVTGAEGFVVDQGLPIHERRRREPFINEFLRPRGVHDTATAFLDDAEGGCVRLLVFRNRRQGCFEASELRAFDRSLPYLRAAAMISRGTLLSTARRRAEPFDRRGEPVFYLGPDGRVIDVNTAAQGQSQPLRILNRRLTATWQPDQALFDRALTATLAKAAPSLVTLNGGFGVMALIMPVAGEARDLFGAVSAIVVLIDPTRWRTVDDTAVDLLSTAAGLTGRELDVVRQVGSGRSPREAAEDLGMGYGTLRNHLKAGFAKLGVHGQGELAALVERLR